MTQDVCPAIWDGTKLRSACQEPPRLEFVDADQQLQEMIPHDVGLGLMKHAYSAFFYLSRFLRSLYIAEQCDYEAVPAPW